MNFGYDYTHSAPDGNGVEYISFMLEPERLDGHGLRCGKDRQKNRAKTFPGLAKAMAEQWGGN